MSQPIKITDSEMLEIKTLQAKFEEIFLQLGHLGVDKIELDRLVNEFVTKEKQIKDEWINLKKREQDLLDKIVKTYGTGNLDMKDGTFIPSVTSSQTVK